MITFSSSMLLRSAPYFPVGNVENTVAFYEKVFGFALEYTTGKPAQFAICSRDGFAVMLRQVATSESIRTSEQQGGTWDAFFWVDTILPLHSEFVSNGAEVVYGPTIQEAYGMREFAVRDLDGHVLGFGEQL